MRVIQNGQWITVIASLSGNVRKEWTFRSVGEIADKIAYYRACAQEVVGTPDMEYFKEEIGVLVSALRSEFGINVVA